MVVDRCPNQPNKVVDQSFRIARIAGRVGNAAEYATIEIGQDASKHRPACIDTHDVPSVSLERSVSGGSARSRGWNGHLPDIPRPAELGHRSTECRRRQARQAGQIAALQRTSFSKQLEHRGTMIGTSLFHSGKILDWSPRNVKAV
jgi:hypothetical protein